MRACELMSARGTRFLHKWIACNVRKTVGAEAISAGELTHKLLTDARALGIGSSEIEEDTGSIYEFILDAIVNRNAPRTRKPAR